MTRIFMRGGASVWIGEGRGEIPIKSEHEKRRGSFFVINHRVRRLMRETPLPQPLPNPLL